MSLVSNIQFEQLNTDFKHLISLEKIALEHKTAINTKLGEVKNTYQYLIKNNNNKKIFLFCLDSLFFQYKCHSMEYENLSKSLILIVNRMYGDYYKLYNILIVQLKEKNIILKSAEEPKKFSVYKDLEPFFEYSIAEITDIHQSVMDIIQELHTYYNHLEKSAYQYSITSNVGMTIANFMHTLQYENTLIREQIHLYINYLSFFHASHEKYLQNLVQKIQNFQQNMEDEIKNEQGENMDMSNIDLECVFASSENVEIEEIIQESEQVLESAEKIIEQVEQQEAVELVVTEPVVQRIEEAAEQ
jgi:hypothetical protein